MWHLDWVGDKLKSKWKKSETVKTSLWKSSLFYGSRHLFIKCIRTLNVYRKQQKEDLYYDDSWIFGFTFEGMVFVIFTFWWSKKDMLEDPDLKKDMIWANVPNVLFFSITAFIVIRWILRLFSTGAEFRNHLSTSLFRLDRSAPPYLLRIGH